MRLNGIFKDNMVFQRGEEIRVFGVSVKGAEVTAVVKDGAEVLSQGQVAVASDDGTFVVILPALTAGGPYALEVASSEYGASVVIDNVYIGEVWLAGGQSNMEYPLGRSANAAEIVASCPKTRIHFYNVPVFDKVDEEMLAAEAETKWNVIDSSTCYGMTGIGFYFMMKIQEYMETHADDGEQLHYGVIGCYLGGTSVSCWQSFDALKKTPEGQRYIDMFQAECDKWASKEEYLAAEAAYLDECEEFGSKVEAVLRKDPYITYFDVEKITGPGAWPPPVGPLSMRRPGALFEAMVMRIVPYALRGVIFYQGEEDTNGHSDDYAVVFRSLIEEWRALFRNADMPFLFCKLPVFPPEGDPEEVTWEALRVQQQIAADTVPNTYMADIMDCGEIGNVHPSDKKTPGERLAALALKNVYGFDY